MNNNNIWYVYRHIRLDKNEPFYIGIGTTKNYKRAFAKSSRNSYWKNITKTTDYKVQILFEGLTEKEAKDKEMELIELYKRKCDGGILCNMTKGGDGVLGLIHTTEYRKKMSEVNKGRKPSEETLKKLSLFQRGRAKSDSHKNKISESLKGKKHSEERIKNIKLGIKKIRRGAENNKSKKVICTQSNKVWDNAFICWELLFKNEMSYTSFNNRLRGKVKNTTTIIYL